MDGIPITDMARARISPTYYDFDMFQEMQVDDGRRGRARRARRASGMNFVLRSGTNRFMGLRRYYFENDSMQSDNVSPTILGQVGSYNRMDQYKDTGFEVGGPILKDRLWVWGAYGETQPNARIYSIPALPGRHSQTAPMLPVDAARNLHDVSGQQYAVARTTARSSKNYSFKVNGDINSATRASFTYFRGNKEKFGRGASATHPDETTWNQKGPTHDVQGRGQPDAVSNSLFLTARYAHITGGFSLTPRGGTGVTAYRDDNGVWHGNYLVLFDRSSAADTLQLDGNTFKGMHELKFGFGWRKATVSSETSWPGGNATRLQDGYPDMRRRSCARPCRYNGNGGLLELLRVGHVHEGSLHVQPRRAVGPSGRLSAATRSPPANPSIPNILPALSASGDRQRGRLELLRATSGLDLRPGQGPQDDAARQLRDVRRSSTERPATVCRWRRFRYYCVRVLACGRHATRDGRFSRASADVHRRVLLHQAIPTSNANKVGDYTTPRTDEFVVGARP